MEFIQILHNDWEEKRIEKLNRCRKSRENIIMEQKVVNNAQPRERSHQKNIDSNKMQKETKKALNKNLTVVSSFSTNRNLKNVESQKLTVADKGKTDTSAPVISTQSPSPVQVNDSVLHASAFQTVPDSITPHSDRSSRLKVSQLSGRSRSRSVELQNRHLRSEQSTVSLKSSFVFGHPSKLASGYITPQIQRDKRLVEVMKDRRRRDEDDGKLRQTKWMEWNTDLKRNNEIKKREEVRRQKELAESHR
uniref:Uncharacterized protein n=1 Tax=Ciona savignyi TaxID=51511 RepID=H2YAT4_CIOSA